jgi:hypothetical protein
MPPPPTLAAESLDALRARYPLALEHVYDQVAIAAHGGIRPGEVAANLFLFEDGLYLIVSRERGPDGEMMIHFSASFKQDSAMDLQLRERRKAIGDRVGREWLRSIPARFRELSGDDRDVQFLGVSQQGIPHWLIEE